MEGLDGAGFDGCAGSGAVNVGGSAVMVGCGAGIVGSSTVIVGSAVAGMGGGVTAGCPTGSNRITPS